MGHCIKCTITFHTFHTFHTLSHFRMVRIFMNVYSGLLYPSSFLVCHIYLLKVVCNVVFPVA